MSFNLNFLNPFHKNMEVVHEEQHSTPYSIPEIKELEKSLQAGKKIANGDYIQKSFTKGHARTGNNTTNTGLTMQSKLVNTTDITNEIRKKRLLLQLSNNIIVQSILRTRDAQVMKFCHPSTFSNDGVGYKIEPRNPKNDGTLTKQQQKDINRISKFIYNTGCPDAIKPSRDKFPDFVVKLIRNHYVYDQVNVERIFDPDNPNKLDHFNMVDAGTIVFNRTPQNIDSPRSFLQYTNTHRTHPIHFNEKEMTFVTTHGGSIDQHGYGYGAVEAAINELQFERDTESYNARFFSQGGTTRGILVIDTGGDTQATAAAMKDLREQWQSTAQGLSGAWKIPVISASNADFVNMSQSSKDMEFERWLNYLINVICDPFEIAPDEINFPNRGGGATSKSASSSINEGSSQRNRLKQSKDKGLIPLMNFIQDFINDHILNWYAPQYRFVFTLGDDQDELKHQQIQQAKENNGLTVNEYRKQEGLPPLKVLNNAFSQFPGNPATVVQELQIEEALNPQLNQTDQAKSDIKNDANPNHQNTQVNTQQQLNQQQQTQQNNQSNSKNNK